MAPIVGEKVTGGGCGGGESTAESTAESPADSERQLDFAEMHSSEFQALLSIEGEDDVCFESFRAMSPPMTPQESSTREWTPRATFDDRVSFKHLSRSYVGGSAVGIDEEYEEQDDEEQDDDSDDEDEDDSDDEDEGPSCLQHDLKKQQRLKEKSLKNRQLRTTFENQAALDINIHREEEAALRPTPPTSPSSQRQPDNPPTLLPHIVATAAAAASTTCQPHQRHADTSTSGDDIVEPAAAAHVEPATSSFSSSTASSRRRSIDSISSSGNLKSRHRGRRLSAPKLQPHRHSPMSVADTAHADETLLNLNLDGQRSKTIESFPWLGPAVVIP